MEGRIAKLFRSGLSLLMVLCMVVAMCPAVFAANVGSANQTIDTSALIEFGTDMMGYLPEDLSAAFDKLVEMIKEKDPAAAEELIQYAKDHGIFEAVKKALDKIDADTVAKAENAIKDIIANADEFSAALKNEVLTLDENLKTLKGKVEDTRNQLTDLKAEADSLKADADAKKAEADELKAQADDKKAEADQLKADADAKWAEAEGKKAELDAKRKEYEGKEIPAQVQKEIDDAQKAYDDAKATYEQALADYNAGVAKYEEGVAKYNEGIAQYNEAVALYEETMPKLQEAIDALGVVIEKLDVAIKQVEEQMPRIEAAAARMEAYAAELKAVAVTLKNDGFLAGIRQIKPIADNMLDDARELTGFVSEENAAKINHAIDKAEAKLNELYIEAGNRYYNVIEGEYNITADSYYVALGDGSAYGESYVNELATELAALYGADYAFKNLAVEGMAVEDIFGVLEANKAEIEKADLITVGFGNESLTKFVVDQMTKLFANKPVDIDWSWLVNAEGQAYIEEARTELYEQLTAKGLFGDFEGVDAATAMVTLVESYAYSYASYIYYLPKALEEIQAINPDAEIVVVGTYNLLDGVSLVMNDRKVNIGSYMDYVVEATDLSTLAVSMLNNNVTFVDAPEAETLNTESEMTALGFVANFNTGYLLPSANGHAYIAQEILNALTITADKIHEHQMGPWEYSSYPDCVHEGWMIRRCTTCGSIMETRYVAPWGHAFGAWTVTKEATCTEKGEETRTCAVCGAAETQEIEATGHTFGEWAVTKEATCTEKGEETRECACGEKETREIEAKGHSFGEWAVTKKATCTEKGEETRTCAVCGTTETREIETTGHTFGEWTVTTPATCTDKGVETRTCANCGEAETREVAATGVHTFGEWTVTTPASCTEKGEETRQCACGEKETREIEAAGHTFGEWTVTKEPTSEAEGEETRTCTVCGATETRPIEKLAAEKNNLWWILLIVAGVGGAGTGGYFFLKKKQIF